MCLGDTPALNWLGGFKEAVSKANKFCRMCLIEKKQQPAFCELDVVRRDKVAHDFILERMHNEKDPQIASQISIKCGINTDFFLTGIDNFDHTMCLLQDPMHIFFEGICHLELSKFLNYSFKYKLFDLVYLNSRIRSFNYFYSDKNDRPNEIDKNNLDKATFTQTSGQMIILFNNLPLLIGEKFTSDNLFLKNFIRLINIINVCLCYYYDSTTILHLKSEIEKYLKSFKELYPDVQFTPKMHFLIHLPNQMKEFGPLRLHSTIRFEAKNGLMKSQKFVNFKHIQKSISYRQEHWMLMNVCDEDFNLKKNVLPRDFEWDKKSVIVNRFRYNIGSFIMLNDFERIKQFGKIIEIIEINDKNICFKIDIYKVDYYSELVNCFICKKLYLDARNQNSSSVFLDNLINKQPVIFFEKEEVVKIQIRYFNRFLTKI